MKTVIDQNLLSKELKKISPVIGKNQVMPILSCVKMDFGKDEVVITGTNLNSWISCAVPCKNKTAFAIAVDMSDLIDVCGKASGPITIEPGEENHKFSHAKGTIKLSVIAEGKDYPMPAEVDYFDSMDVDGSFFFSMTNANVCRSREELKPHLNTIGLDFKKDGLTVIGIDGYIMHKQEFEIKSKKPVVISVNHMFSELSKSFQQSNLELSNKYIRATCGSSSVTSTLSETRYVDYTIALKGLNNEWNLEVNRVDLLSTLDVIDIATTKSLKNILFTITPGNINLFTKEIYVGKEAESDISASTQLDTKIRVNATQLKSVLSTVRSETVSLSIPPSHGNIYIKPEGEDNILLSVMPLLLTDLNN